MTSSNLSHLLTTKRFLPLFTTQSLAAFNDSLFRNTLIMLINYKLAIISHQNPASLTAWVAGIFILPFLLFSATGGELADKFPKSTLIRAIKIAEISITILGTIGLLKNDIFILYFTLFLMGVHSALFGPVKYAIMPELLAPEELLGGNSWFESSTFVAILLGSIAASIGFDLKFGMYLIPAVFFSCAVIALITGFMIPRTTAIVPDLKISWNFIGKTYEVIKYSTENKLVFVSIFCISWLWCIGVVLTTELPVLFKQLFNVAPEVISCIIAVFTIGIAIGSLLCNKISGGVAKFGYTPWAILGMSIFIFDLCYACHIGIPKPTTNLGLLPLKYIFQFDNTWRMFFDIFILSTCGGVYVLPFIIVLQTKPKASHRSRVLASNSIMNAVFMVIASILIIVLLKLGLSVLGLFIGVGMVNAIFAIWLLYQLPVFRRV